MRTALIATTLMVSDAVAHDWYPRECCGNVDCAPVERVEPLPDGSQRLTSRVGTTVIPASFPRQPSPDNQMHICMVRYSHLDGMRPICLFVPMDALRTPSGWGLISRNTAAASSGMHERKVVATLAFGTWE